MDCRPSRSAAAIASAKLYFISVNGSKTDTSNGTRDHKHKDTSNFNSKPISQHATARAKSASGHATTKAVSKKNSKKDNAKKGCVFCNSDVDDEYKYGALLKKDGIITHYFCLLLSSGLAQAGDDSEGIMGFYKEDILAEVTRGYRLRCVYCNHKGATIGCIAKSCRKVFHYGCGVSHNSLTQFFGNFGSYCCDHRPKQEESIQSDRLAFKGTGHMSCLICTEPVETRSSVNTLKTPCCNNIWFHRKCLQTFALSAGAYFFKCPHCGNQESFTKEMMVFGIYVPLRDASWEQEPDAFSDLLERHSRCDIKCLCPKGRNYDHCGGKDWEIVLCDYCGSQGAHLKCAGLLAAKELPTWVCPFCAKVTKQKVTSSNSQKPSTVTTANNVPVSSQLPPPRPDSQEEPQTTTATTTLPAALRAMFGEDGEPPSAETPSKESPSPSSDTLSNERPSVLQNCITWSDTSGTVCSVRVSEFPPNISQEHLQAALSQRYPQIVLSRCSESPSSSQGHLQTDKPASSNKRKLQESLNPPAKKGKVKMEGNRVRGCRPSRHIATPKRSLQLGILSQKREASVERSKLKEVVDSGANKFVSVESPITKQGTSSTESPSLRPNHCPSPQPTLENMSTSNRFFSLRVLDKKAVGMTLNHISTVDKQRPCTDESEEEANAMQSQDRTGVNCECKDDSECENDEQEYSLDEIASELDIDVEDLKCVSNNENHIGAAAQLVDEDNFLEKLVLVSDRDDYGEEEDAGESDGYEVGSEDDVRENDDDDDFSADDDKSESDDCDDDIKESDDSDYEDNAQGSEVDDKYCGDVSGCTTMKESSVRGISATQTQQAIEHEHILEYDADDVVECDDDILDYLDDDDDDILEYVGEVIECTDDNTSFLEAVDESATSKNSDDTEGYGSREALQSIGNKDEMQDSNEEEDSSVLFTSDDDVESGCVESDMDSMFCY